MFDVSHRDFPLRYNSQGLDLRCMRDMKESKELRGGHFKLN